MLVKRANGMKIKFKDFSDNELREKLLNYEIVEIKNNLFSKIEGIMIIEKPVKTSIKNEEVVESESEG